MSSQTTTKLTYEDYVMLPDDGNRYEIIDGELYVNPAPVPRHQRIVKHILLKLETYLVERRSGEVLMAPIDVLLEEHSIVEPDLIVIRSANASIVGQKNVQGPPDLVVEVLSERTRKNDEILKRKLYERSGVTEYWIVDPVLESVKIYRRTASAYERVAEMSTESGGAITSPLFPDFSLDLHDVFAD